ncbi:hypothetical protein COU57_04460 [Candidatus Pacearchaeota archaeon CG10_big_fil_rev_8_21_14_0_10_32_14]|nr:MAG: hypothetical protein COU57_04460 [Candidatus Pacearchaeota archaeon CG10_big_fil_rev_8_21_14_0_10_32_14]
MIQCVEYIAIKTQEYSTCDKYPLYKFSADGGITKNLDRDEEVNSCYMLVAISNGDLEKCSVIIEGKSFKVVGILEEGSSVYMPTDIAREILDESGYNDFDNIKIKIGD